MVLAVQTEEASAYSESLAMATASSSSVNVCTVITGPNTSVRISSSDCFRSAITVGS